MKINTAIALGSTSVVAFWLKGADDETQRRAGDCDLKGARGRIKTADRAQRTEVMQLDVSNARLE